MRFHVVRHYRRKVMRRTRQRATGGLWRALFGKRRKRRKRR